MSVAEPTAESAVESAVVAVEGRDESLSGRRFYRPGVVAGYCVLSMPIGMILYGLNEARHGRRPAGYVLVGVAAVAAVGFLVGAMMGAQMSSFGSIGIFLAISLYCMESRRFSLARPSGALDARWWPPLLWMLAALLVASIIVALLGSTVSQLDW